MAVLQELKHIMASHGGIFRNYIQKEVTHIICSNLPDSKVKHRENVKERYYVLTSLVSRTGVDRCYHESRETDS